jgi:hypothetical protein
LILVILSASCRTVKSTSTAVSQNSSDSVSHQVIDTTYQVPFTVPPDSAWIKAWFECDKNGKVIMHELEVVRGQRINPQVILKDNVIRIRIPVDTMRIYMAVKSRFESTYRENKTEKKQVTDSSKAVYKTSVGAIIIAFVCGIIFSIVIYFGYRKIKNRIL